MTYNPINFNNGQAGGTPVSASNLRHVENGIVAAHNDIAALTANVNSLSERYGTPLVAHTAAEMTDNTKIYVYVGSETGYTTGNWYYYDGDSWESGGAYNSTAVNTDKTLTQEDMAADSKKVGDEISDLKSAIQQGGSFNAEVKSALETLLANVVYKGNDPTGRTYLTALHNAMYPPVNLSYITAVYTQSGTVYDTDSLDDLKADLVVTAHYDDYSTDTVTTYVLSGTLTEGTSTITVTYGGKTTTFNVTVTVVHNYVLNYKFSDITLTDGYIGDGGTIVSASDNKFYDRLIPALGFWFVKGSTPAVYANANLYLRIAEYDSSGEFIKRDAISNGKPAFSTDSNTTQIKIGSNLWSGVEQNADRFVACNLLDTSICTIPNKTIDANGDEGSSNDSSISDFLPVTEGVIVCQLVQNADSALVVFYDSSKNFVSRHAVTSSLTNKTLIMNVPNTAAYVRFRCPNSPVGNIYVSYEK